MLLMSLLAKLLFFSFAANKVIYLVIRNSMNEKIFVVEWF